jgi:hypothetical protein
LLIAATTVALLLVPSAAWGLVLDASIPTAGASPIAVTLAAGESAAYRISVGTAETLSLSLSLAPAQPATLDLDLYVYGPSATETNHASASAKSVMPATGYPETISYRVPAPGIYYVEVYAAENSGQGTLTWKVLPEPLLPVYRFYNLRTGTHFFTPSDAEAADVKAKWPTIFRYEGVAYSTRASRNTQPLYRFYNKVNGSHFYTADVNEKNRVIAQWSSTYNYEGETYKVSVTNDGSKTPVHRFYNVRNGSHFFTASEAERLDVMARYGSIYRYEGVVFYLGQ